MYFSNVNLKYFIFFLIWLTPIFALADPWQIDQDENFITLKKNGEIQHGNNIHFNFDKDNDFDKDIKINSNKQLLI